MKTLYESILDDNIEDQYSPDQLLIKKTEVWLSKYIPHQNVLHRLSINGDMVDMNGVIEIPKRTTLLPKGVKLGNVAYFSLEDSRYFDKGLLPKHSDIFVAKYCQRPKTDIIINCSQATIGGSLSMNKNSNMTINIEDSKMVNLLPGSIWFNSLPPSTSIKHIKFNSNNIPVNILWESFTMIEESIPNMLEDFFSNLKYVLSKQRIKKLVKEEIFKRIKIDEINKYWPEVQTIWFTTGRGWMQGNLQQDMMNIANDPTKIQSSLILHECCIFRKGNDWDVIYKN